ncbi:hypothetical protein FQZ97_1048020 [compost metagenome]
MHKPQTLPSTYLLYAKQDLKEEDGARSFINAVGNAKRAFHLQTETLCDALGWTVLHKKKSFGFDKRLEYLSSCGILSPGILSRLNKTRNKVEHEYFIPEAEQVQDYLDIVELYIFATGQLLNSFPYEISFELMDDEDHDKSLNLPTQIRFKMNEEKLDSFYINHKTEKLEKKITDPDYFPWLKAIFEQYLLF